jgi:hypothetical protein
MFAKGPFTKFVMTKHKFSNIVWETVPGLSKLGGGFFDNSRTISTAALVE